MTKATKPKEAEKEAATFRLTPSLLRKVKYIAFMDKTTQTDIVEASLSDYVSKWEKEHGPITV